jgi:broad specificity phosphatase PhoE
MRLARKLRVVYQYSSPLSRAAQAFLALVRPSKKDADEETS